MQDVEPVQPVLTVDLFAPLSGELIALLRSLAFEDWDKPTACAGWSVKDVAAHLLGGNLGRLQDPQAQNNPRAPGSFAELVDMINRNNAEWVRAARRINRKQLTGFLEQTDRELADYFKTLPPSAPARIGVSWAGEEQSLNWFDIAREYTEKWLHQQHIREAVARPVLDSRRWLHPVLDTFMRALPHAYRSNQAPEGTLVSFTLAGEAGGDWSLCKQNGEWGLFSGSAAAAAAHASMKQDTAWRLFTRGLDPETARSQIRIEGDPTLGRGILEMVTIMA